MSFAGYEEQQKMSKTTSADANSNHPVHKPVYKWRSVSIHQFSSGLLHHLSNSPASAEKESLEATPAYTETKTTGDTGDTENFADE